MTIYPLVLLKEFTFLLFSQLNPRIEFFPGGYEVRDISRAPQRLRVMAILTSFDLTGSLDSIRAPLLEQAENMAGEINSSGIERYTSDPLYMPDSVDYKAQVTHGGLSIRLVRQYVVATDSMIHFFDLALDPLDIADYLTAHKKYGDMRYKRARSLHCKPETKCGI